MQELLEIAPEVADALADGGAVVALESALIAHGLPSPENLETAARLEAAVRAAGAVPATIALVDGRVRIGLGAAELERLASARGVAKVSRRDLAATLQAGALGATTVAATLACAAAAGIRVLATGGIGGVHRGAPGAFDVSADLTELARSPLAVVCAGAKSVLDLPRTLEVLETLGVPVVGYGTDELPAFFARSAGLRLEARVDTPAAAATLLRLHWGLGLSGAVVFAVPPPAEAALDGALVEGWIARAVAEAEKRGVAGKALTPFLLAELARLSGGATLSANVGLLEHNAGVGGAVARACAAKAA